MKWEISLLPGSLSSLHPLSLLTTSVLDLKRQLNDNHQLNDFAPNEE
jgi:hypothetical protein